MFDIATEMYLLCFLYEEHRIVLKHGDQKMHEVSLMYEIIKTAQISANEHGLRKVLAIEIIIGDRLSILPESLIFAFDCLKKGTILNDSTIKWEISTGYELYITYIEGE